MRDHNDTKLVEKRERGANVGIATERRREVKKPSTPPPSFLGSTNREGGIWWPALWLFADWESIYPSGDTRHTIRGNGLMDTGV